MKMKYEILEPDRFYHIYNRGNNKENLFKEERNYTYFLNLLKKYIISVAEVYSYCLLKNHFHILIRPKEVESKLISRAFSNMFNTYTKSINKAYDREGSLFRDRFSRIHVDSEEYLKSLILYIHLNPSYHQFTNNFKLYPHSSYHSIISEKNTLLQRDEVISLFGDRDNFIYEHERKQYDLKELIEQDLKLED